MSLRPSRRPRRSKLLSGHRSEVGSDPASSLFGRARFPRDHGKTDALNRGWCHHPKILTSNHQHSCQLQIKDQKDLQLNDVRLVLRRSGSYAPIAHFRLASGERCRAGTALLIYPEGTERLIKGPAHPLDSSSSQGAFDTHIGPSSSLSQEILPWDTLFSPSLSP